MKKALFVGCAILACAGFFGLTALAAALVNINTADSATLQTLNGIGPSKAQAILDYRTQNGPFASIEDIKKVSGIGDATYANIKDYITVNAATQTAAQTDKTNATSSSPNAAGTASANTTGTGNVSLRIHGSAAAVAGAELWYSVETSDDALDVTNTDFIWNFDDGTVAQGSRANHAFLYPGKYVVTVSALAHRQETRARLTVDVVAPAISLIVESDGALGIYNGTAQEVDIGGWTIAGSEASFTFPDTTLVLPNETLRFAASVTGIANPLGARLLFQSGQIVALAQRESQPSKEMSAASPAAAHTSVQSAPEKVEASSTLVAATAKSDAGLPWWSYGAALAVLLMVAAAGVFFVHPASAPATATADPADEFEII